MRMMCLSLIVCIRLDFCIDRWMPCSRPWKGKLWLLDRSFLAKFAVKKACLSSEATRTKEKDSIQCQYG